MKETNLHIFYRLGEGLTDLRQLKIGMPAVEILMLVLRPREWLDRFLSQTKDVPMPKARAAASSLNRILSPFNTLPVDFQHQLTQDDMWQISSLLDNFEKEFEREQQNINVFTVLPKGIYDTRALLESAEKKFPESVRGAFTAQIIYDLQQAGRCLAFECPTASAFHMFRATEALLLKYYETVAGNPWDKPQRDWGKYVEALEKLPNPNRDLLSRLNEIRGIDRNPYTHPDRNVSHDEAPMLFELSYGVMYRMAEEIVKLRLEMK
jgi:hypothetical protein